MSHYENIDVLFSIIHVGGECLRKGDLCIFCLNFQRDGKVLLNNSYALKIVQSIVMEIHGSEYLIGRPFQWKV